MTRNELAAMVHLAGAAYNVKAELIDFDVRSGVVVRVHVDGEPELVRFWLQCEGPMFIEWQVTDVGATD